MVIEWVQLILLSKIPPRCYFLCFTINLNFGYKNFCANPKITTTTDNLNKWCVITNAGSIFNRKARSPISFTPPGANARKIAAGVISEINFTIKMKGNNDIIKVITTETE